MKEERFESYISLIMNYVKYQENKPYIESILEDMKYTLFREDREYIKELQQENKQLKETIKEATRILNSAKNHYGNDGKNWALERVINLLGDKEWKN